MSKTLGLGVSLLLGLLLTPNIASAFGSCQDPYPGGGTLQQHCQALSAQPPAHCVIVPYACQCPMGFCDCLAQPQTPAPAGSLCSIGDMDVNDCTSDVCDGNGNCAHAPYPDQTPCADPTDNPCTYDYCTAGVCQHVPTSGFDCLSDGNDCTLDICQNGGCAHIPRAVGLSCGSDANPCTSDICNGSGTCTHPNLTGGKVCNNMCIGANTCCTSADCAAIPNGSGTCQSPGSFCLANCNVGYRTCNGNCIGTSQCCGDIECNGNGHVCGANNTCTCGPGKYECGGVCISNGTCCAALSNCPSVPHGTGVCAATGGACTFACEAGYHACGGSCIPANQCCDDTECTSLTNAGTHRHGVCTAMGCVGACDGGYKSCNGACIANNQCCNASDCTTPQSGCYKTQGACEAGSCTYAYNDGATCNADNDACTPNDKCMSGTCVADTAHTVQCFKRDCHGPVACNKTNGNCEDTALTNGTTCGANGCAAAAGSCTGGACSVAPKDCSSLNGDCQVGMCDASQPVGTPCAAANKPNGLACAVGDKCVLAPACSGGVCTGERKTCSPSGPCRSAECNPSTGECEETVVAVGTACGDQGGCLQNATCDATGACGGSPLPDGSPCDKDKCDLVGACAGGSCVCVNAPDFGGGPAPIIPDMGPSEPDVAGDGCSVAAAHTHASPLALAFLALALLALARRTRRPKLAFPHR